MYKDSDGTCYFLVDTGMYTIVQEAIHRPDPVSGHGLVSYLLGYAYINMPHRFSDRQMKSQPSGFTWATKPWKTMELLSWRQQC